mmetsp:Transcript_157/g.199  ORF Transcript_157/g.199 Transcript_157/m.199 type:complete len:140 (+) Transcript_157:74-493(+)
MSWYLKFLRFDLDRLLPLGTCASLCICNECFIAILPNFLLKTLIFSILLTYTHTSMMDVDEKGTSTEYWSKITKYFSIRKSSFQEANDFMSQHVVQIAQDNMKGQCTIGHSCKVSSKEKLQRFVDVELEQSQLVNIVFD